jgi:murein DD-endopeptidase MepM/ murein hydrolase activator NlpD
MMASKLTDIVNPVLSDDTTLSLDFGNTYSDGSFHKGIDVYSTEKRECYVIAPCDGTITQAVNNIKGTNRNTGTLGMGNYVYLQTDMNYRLRFQHLKYNSLKVKKGSTVKKGDILGIIGNTGYSSGRHLHFDVSCAGKNSNGRYVSSQNRTYFDPKPFIRGAKSLTKSTQKASESGSEVKLYTVTASALRVRSGAGLTYSAVDTIKRGTKVRIYEIKNGFGKISESSSKWVSMEYAKEV